MNFSKHFGARSLRRIFTAVCIMALTACGGGGSGSDNFFNAPDPGGPSGGGSGGTGGTGGAGGTGGSGGTGTVASFGAIINGTFVQGTADVGVANLSAGGTTEVSVALRDQNGNAITDNLTYLFTSGCAADSTASLETNVESATGQATAEYVAEGCVGSDEIRATVTVGEDTLVAIGTVIVEQESIGSIEFVSADPTQIALSGTGGDETSRVTFRVVGEAGATIRDAAVDFALNSTTGGMTVTPSSAVSNTNGEVSTIVRAGTIATSVRVTATEASTGASTQSSQLVVSTGIPDFDSFSGSQSVFNPEALNFDGETVEITIRAADAFNNPVPDGTTVSFFAEGGSIGPSCSTANGGVCSVNWTSQDPRPANGRVTILATSIGNESFTDEDGDGRFDDVEAFTDLGEAFADQNENGTYEAGEFFVDFNSSGVRDVADGGYNGVLCDDQATNCSASRSVTVFSEFIVIMSGSNALNSLLRDFDTGAVISESSTINVTTDAARRYDMLIADENGNRMPVGTTASLAVTSGFELSGASSITVSNSSGGPTVTQVPITVRAETAGTETTGTLTLTVTTPKNIVTTFFWDLVK